LTEAHATVVLMHARDTAARVQLETLMAKMRKFDTSQEYFALTLTASDDGKLCWGMDSCFAGVGSRRGFELREACLVYPDKMAFLWESVGQPWLSVEGPTQFALFLRLGGNALVEAETAREWLEDVIAPHEVAPNSLAGFRWLDTVDRTALRRRPTKGLGGYVRRRDDHRCALCGSTTDLRLHHVRPWADGGLTEEENLLTLCRECEESLEPHSALIYVLMPKVDWAGKAREELARGIANYRKIAAAVARRL
jgi:HNH endonuclease